MTSKEQLSPYDYQLPSLFLPLMRYSCDVFGFGTQYIGRHRLRSRPRLALAAYCEVFGRSGYKSEIRGSLRYRRIRFAAYQCRCAGPPLTYFNAPTHFKCDGCTRGVDVNDVDVGSVVRHSLSRRAQTIGTSGNHVLVRGG